MGCDLGTPSSEHVTFYEFIVSVTPRPCSLNLENGFDLFENYTRASNGHAYRPYYLAIRDALHGKAFDTNFSARHASLSGAMYIAALPAKKFVSIALPCWFIPRGSFFLR